jgi:hypothetical protein
MAKRGTSKWYSVQQEEYVARCYDGKRSKSSGGAAHDCGDVRVAHGKSRPGVLIECKYTMKPPKKLLDEFEKIAREAFPEGREPMLALRWYAPESILANHEGYVDLTMRTMDDDRMREAEYREDRQV